MQNDLNNSISHTISRDPPDSGNLLILISNKLDSAHPYLEKSREIEAQKNNDTLAL